ncbi:MAG: hypothetical protein IPN02_07790 [Candidatus Microthrix sp.]|uniref:Uncharacterized protein n=1 Tax=Candidatus Neomicrothrix subdominans TaxID=2954438 RepID=A0A936NBP7_9ACTN|nr:hypothetical protein [Candidatus Microthrix subdominans]
MPNYNSNRIKAMAVQNEGDELTAAFWFSGENEGWLRFSTTSTEVDAYSIDNLRQVLVMASRGCSFYADAQLKLLPAEIERSIEDAVDAGTLQFSNEIPEMLGAASAPEA